MRNIFLLLAITLFTACSHVNMYQSLPEVKAWEPDIRKFEQSDQNEYYPDNAIIFTGSSSIRLWSTLKNDMAPYPVIQRGFGGSKLSDFTVYADRIISPHKCSAIVIFIANDITGGASDKTPEAVEELFSNSLKIIRRTHPKTPVFWIGITPTPSRWKAWPEIKKASGLIRKTCDRKKNTYYIDTESAFLDGSGLPVREYFRSDMLHLNDEGYKVWSKIIKDEMKKVVPMPVAEIIAHRGASYDAPENTVASSKLAWQLGADAVECDIYLSSDNKIIVSHDANTKRTTGKSHLIKETNSDTLRLLDAGSWKGEKFRGEKLPFLSEIISAVPVGKELVVEIKCGSEVLPELKKTIEAPAGKIRFTFIGFDFQTISETKKTFPGYPCYWLCSNADLLQKNISLVKAAGLDGISLGYGIVNEKVAKQAKDMGIGLYTWTVDDPIEAKRMISLGVKGITTNRPGYIRAETK